MWFKASESDVPQDEHENQTEKFSCLLDVTVCRPPTGVPRPLLGPEPQSENLKQRIKALVFGRRLASVCVSNKCCFDMNASGQESVRCPQTEPLKPSD